MKKLLLVLFLVVTPMFAADTKISALTAGGAVQDADLFPIARSGANFSVLGSAFCRVASCTMTAPIVADASLTNTGYLRVGSTSASFFFLDAGGTATAGFNLLDGTVDFYTGTGGVQVIVARTLDTELRLGSGKQITWSSNANPTAAVAADVGLARSGAAVARVTDGSSGLGYIIAGVPIEANTGTKAPIVIESGELYTNTGDGDGSIVNLPNDPTIGTTYSFALTAAQTVTINAASGETIIDTGSSGTSTAAGAIGDTLQLVAVTGGPGAVWMVTKKTGSWTVTP